MWWRIPVGVFINVVAYVAFGVLIAFLQVLGLRGAATGEAAVTVDLPTMETYLGVSAISSLVAAWIAALSVSENRLAPLIGGVLLLAMFIPVQMSIWDKFPIWYHATFLTSLPVLAWIGGRLALAT
jgi:hypothetical protein